MTARAYNGPFPCNLTRTVAHIMADEVAAELSARITSSHHEMLSRGVHESVRARGVA